MESIWTLLVVFKLKHFFADYIFQNHYMLGKFKKYPDYIYPLLAHSLVHGIFTATISSFYLSTYYSIVLGITDTSIHFIVDRIKASPELLGRYEALSKREAKTLIETGILPGGSAPASHDKVMTTWKSNTLFWWSLGFDQLLHSLTDIFIIYAILSF